MSTELEHFISLFATEHDLQIALVDLFGKVPGTARVQLLQGPLEHGKDIVFRRYLLPGRPVLIACVVKNIKLDGKAQEHSGGALTVMNQVRQALKNPYRDTDGAEVPVHMVYVITPHEVSREVILAVEGDLIDLRGRFEFLCGSQLLELFKDHYPAYITFKGDFFNSYLQKLISTLEADSATMTLAAAENILSTLHEAFLTAYIEPRFSCHLSAHRLKVDLRNCDFPFSRRVSYHAVEQAVTTLLRISALLSNSDCWTSTQQSDGWHKAGLQLSKLAQELPHWWNVEASGAVSKAAGAGSYVGSHSNFHAIEVNIPPSCASGYDLPALKAACAACLDELSGLLAEIQRAWEEIRRSGISFGGLFSNDGMQYLIRIQELAERCPQLFNQIGRAQSIQASQAQLLSQTHSFTVTGPPGYGKTTFCKWSAVNDAKELLDSTSSVFPVYIPLHKYNEVDPKNFSLLAPELLDFLRSYQAKSRSFSLVRVYLDGLDEVRTQRRKNLILDSAANGMGLPYYTQFVITARDSSYNSRMARYPRFRIGEMTASDGQALVRKLLRDDLKQIDEFWKQVKDSGKLTELLKVPLLLQLIVSVFKKTQKLPQNRYRLYQMFLELLAHGWDRAKNVDRGFSYDSELKLKVVQVLAGRLHTAGRRDANLDDFRACVAGITDVGSVNIDQLLSELVHQGLVVQSGALFLFPHLSFQEYLAARNLNDPSGMRQNRALLKFLRGDDWWREVIAFYINGHSSPSDLELWVRGAVEKLLKTIPPSERSRLASRVANLERMFASSHPGFAARLPTVFVTPESS